MAEIELSTGTIDYEDTGGPGPVLVLLHGLLMDASLWTGPVAELAADHRCVVPTLPLGAHSHPMHPDADLSLPGLARLVAELLARLDLHDVTLVGNDTGGALVQLVVRDGAARVGRIALVSCEAFDNIPPGLTGRTLALAGALPPALFGLVMQQMRLRPMRRAPIAFGWLTARGDAATARWMQPLLRRGESCGGIRRDTVRVLRSLRPARELLLDAPAYLSSFTGPALVVWAAEDRVMPPEHGRRLAELLPRGRLVEVADTRTLIPLDQPAELAKILRNFATDPRG
ncbi:putative hydrolase or acyltransferase of alpha/beta superfamily [Frankia torreyi]|uniref:Putative hydrolase or acyltransferase of alpha/beta superfamily n=1 Tax=Frankia torreyi TaxID=1856 RepID=A0A0D8BC28_9ACTN|nr:MULTISPECIES: alpha/beta hydrolase [Frankia]KJE21645.1 putative hydrolase or acyltransferase of alpha/beta superfamily [Frankia torreyi]KQM03664.1 putative hydrolase or acyltransferase of alpha/beta superfamily [Frankia sp. CpI1-P]